MYAIPFRRSGQYGELLAVSVLGLDTRTMEDTCERHLLLDTGGGRTCDDPILHGIVRELAPCDGSCKSREHIEPDFRVMSLSERLVQKVVDANRKRNDQITKADLKALTGHFRIVRESMDDGDMEIVADVRRYSDAMAITRLLSEEKEDVIYTLYNDQGNALL